MARRRMISEEMLYDEQFNSLSMEAQNLFIRMLAKSDDCGVIPASDYSLNALLNLPDKLRKNLRAFLGEIVSAGMGVVVEHQEKQYFLFKSKSFLKYQSYIINKRHKSEYLDITAEEFDSTIWKSYEEHMKPICPAYGVESREKKVESRKQKELVEVFFDNDLWEKFKQHRKEAKKPLTPTAETAALEKIYKLATGNPHMAEAIVRETIAGSWKGFFPLSKDALDAFRKSELDRVVNKLTPCEYCGKPITETGRYRHEDTECPKYKAAPVKDVLALVNSTKLGVAK
jgi:hypothetical protein